MNNFHLDTIVTQYIGIVDVTRISQQRNSQNANFPLFEFASWVNGTRVDMMALPVFKIPKIYFIPTKIFEKYIPLDYVYEVKNLHPIETFKYTKPSQN